MFRFWLLAVISTSMLFGAFEIKLGVFKDVKNLHHSIAKVKPYTFRKKIKIKKKRALYYTSAQIQGSKAQAKKALKAYKRIFKDAFISGYIKDRSTQAKSSIVKHTNKNKLSKNKKTFKKAIASTTKQSFDIKKLLLDKTIYMCYEDEDRRIVKMDFLPSHILYTPLDKKSTLNIPYTIKGESILLKVLDMDVMHKVIGVTEKYLVLQSSMDGKVRHDLRYYYSSEDAQAYLNKR